MTTLLMIVLVAAVTTGGAILGWQVRARLLGLGNDVDLIDRGEVGDPNHGD